MIIHAVSNLLALGGTIILFGFVILAVTVVVTPMVLFSENGVERHDDSNADCARPI